MANARTLWGRRKQTNPPPTVPPVLSARGRQSPPFQELRAHSGQSQPVRMDVFSPAGEARIYTTLRESVPIIDAAIFRLVRLLGGFEVSCGNSRAENKLRDFFETVSVGGNQLGIYAFVSSYFEQLLTQGTALGELVLTSGGEPAALWNASLEGITLRRSADEVNVEVCAGAAGGLIPVPNPELVFLSVLNPSPGALAGNSLLKGLPYVSRVLLQILNSVEQNWERLGNVRFSVIYNPANDPAERTRVQERAQALAQGWQAAMQDGAGVRDFIATGDVRIQVIGADAPIPDSEIPVRQLLEQIVAKTGLPPFLLGLTWSSTERMSSQQADLLTSELESYRRTLTPVLLRLSSTLLRLWGEQGDCRVMWENISLADEVELSRAALLRAQAAALRESEHMARQPEDIFDKPERSTNGF